MELRYENCANCFKKVEKTETCPNCGFKNNSIKLNPNILSPFTLLDNRYLLGRMLGQGGFGVTYVAMEIESGRICAIKEYMPVEYARRSKDGIHVTMNQQGSRYVYEHGQERFLDEAKTLYRLKENSTVVRILDFFSQNNTAYLVMEYLDGINLKGYVNRSGGRIDQEYAKVILVTIASSMMEIHRKGILHRDISPENIFLTKDGSIKLIDFGSARSFVSSQNKNGMSVLLKPGFAPPEQYDSKGEQGPWTDVYALAATFYTIVSGQKLLDSLYRQRGVIQTNLSELNCGITKKTSDAIEKAMQIKIKNRYQDFREFLNDIDIPHGVEKQKPEEQEVQEKKITENKTQNKKAITYGTKVPIQQKAIDKSRKEKKRFCFFRKRKKGIPVVKIVNGARAGQKFQIITGQMAKIGRSQQQSNLIVDYDSNISRVHCLVKFDEKKQIFSICDVSNNGTFFPDGTKLKQNQGYEIGAGSQFYLVSPEIILMVDLELQ